MAETFINVTEGSGKKLHAWDATVGANTVLDEFTVPGEYPYATYAVQSSSAVSGATGGDDILQIMAGSTLKVRVRRIRVVQAAVITAAAEFSFDLIRITGPAGGGTGGTAVTPRPYDSSDSAAGAGAAIGVPAATHGTAGVTLEFGRFWPAQTLGTGGTPGPIGFGWEWSQMPNMKPIIIPAGTTNGIALRINTGRAGLTVNCHAEFIETTF